MIGHDAFVFAPGGANHWPSNDAVDFGKSAFANIHAALIQAHENSAGDAAVPDTLHAPQWLAHHSDFHLV
jgi:hypothetical protein